MTRRSQPVHVPSPERDSSRKPRQAASRGSLAALLALTLGGLLAPGCGGGGKGGDAPKSGALETTYYDPATRSLKESEGEVRFGRKVGEWTWWHPTQTIAKRGRFDDQGRETGEWIEYHANQVESSRLTYIEGKPEGPALEWHQNGTKRTVGQHTKGLRTGVWESFYESGALETRATYVEGKLEGEALGWHANGAERERAIFRAGVMVGTAEGFGPNGQLVARKTSDDRGRTVGESREWYEDGNPKAIKPHDSEGREHGVEVTFHPTGAVATMRTWEEGKLVGMARGWLDDGRLHYEGPYVDGKRHGIWRSYHLDGTRQLVVRFDADRRTGISRSWFPGGQLNSLQAFEADQPRGLFQQWFPTGRRKLYSERDGEKVVGLTLEWDDDGALVETGSGRFIDNAPTGPLSAEDLAFAEALAADPSPRPIPGEGTVYPDPLPEVLALEAQPTPLPIPPNTSEASDSDR